MSLKDQLNSDYIAATKARDEVRKSATSLLRAAIKQVEVDTQTTLADEGVIGVLQKEAKSRRESIADAHKAGRADLIAAYEAELAVIEHYLPKGLSREELIEMAKAAIAEAGVSDVKQQGAVMKLLSPRTKGRADGKQVSDIVRELLS